MMSDANNGKDGKTLISSFLIAELAAALERLGVFDQVASQERFRIADVARALGLRADLLLEACEFLAEREVLLAKKGEATFQLMAEPAALKSFTGFLLAYRSTFGSFGELMNGSRVYGRDVVRDGAYLKNTAAFTRGSVPLLVERFRKLGVTTAVDVGCGNGELLLALADALPSLRGIGIDHDPATVEAARERIAASSHRQSLLVAHADALAPRSFPAEAKNADAVVGMAVFHEFRKRDRLVPLLGAYKKFFGRARLFIVELDAPSWDDLRREPETPARQLAAFYKLTHTFSDQGAPQPKSAWAETIARSGWRVAAVVDAPTRLVIYECK